VREVVFKHPFRVAVGIRSGGFGIHEVQALVGLQYFFWKVSLGWSGKGEGEGTGAGIQ